MQINLLHSNLKSSLVIHRVFALAACQPGQGDWRKYARLQKYAQTRLILVDIPVQSSLLTHMKTYILNGTPRKTSALR